MEKCSPISPADPKSQTPLKPLHQVSPFDIGLVFDPRILGCPISCRKPNLPKPQETSFATFRAQPCIEALWACKRDSCIIMSQKLFSGQIQAERIRATSHRVGIDFDAVYTRRLNSKCSGNEWITCFKFPTKVEPFLEINTQRLHRRPQPLAMSVPKWMTPVALAAPLIFAGYQYYKNKSKQQDGSTHTHRHTHTHTLAHHMRFIQ